MAPENMVGLENMAHGNLVFLLKTINDSAKNYDRFFPNFRLLRTKSCTKRRFMICAQKTLFFTMMNLCLDF